MSKVSGIDHPIVHKYFQDRPQLKQPHYGLFGFEIPAEWKPFVEALIKKSTEQKKEFPHGT